MSFNFTRKTDYALVALASLAEAEAKGGQPISARHIAEEYDLPLALLMNVMKDLNRAELVDSRRGAGGGYVLAQPADRITIAQVIAAIEGPVAMTACCEEKVADEDQCLGCRLTERCPISGSMQRFNDLIVKFLERMTIAEMMRDDIGFSLNITPIQKADPKAPRNMRLVEVM